MTKQIPLSRGLFAIVDGEDFAWLNQWKWYAQKIVRKGVLPKFYAARNGPKGSKGHTILMHRVIVGAGAGQVTDHRDLDTLNNQRSNLRACTQAQNCLNHNGHRDRKYSRFKGVCFANGRWLSRFRGRHVGSFGSEEEAARAYDDAATAADSVFALTNFQANEAA